MKRLRAAIVGNPIGHSLSPAIFDKFSSALGVPLSYEAIPLENAALGPALRKASRAGTLGWSVTIPHKVRIMRHLDALDKSAKAVGAVNVVRFSSGRLTGYNTDAAGFLAPLKRSGFSLKKKRAVVLGAGGAARAVCAALKNEGIARLFIINRTDKKARALARAFAGVAIGDALAELTQADLVVNATSVGMDGKSNPLPRGARLRRGALAYDLIYRPPRTPFLKSAARQGVRTLSGLEMLVAQAAEAWRIWFGQDVPAALLKTVHIELNRRLRWEN